MTIDRLTATTPIAASTDSTLRRESNSASTEKGSPAVSRRDSVEISTQGRKLAAEDTDRTGEIRARIAEGRYDTPAVLEAVARRLLSSGDL